MGPNAADLLDGSRMERFHGAGLDWGGGAAATTTRPPIHPDKNGPSVVFRLSLMSDRVSTRGASLPLKRDRLRLAACGLNAGTPKSDQLRADFIDISLINIHHSGGGAAPNHRSRTEARTGASPSFGVIRDLQTEH